MIVAGAGNGIHLRHKIAAEGSARGHEDLPKFLALALDPRVTRLVGDGSSWSRERAIERFESGRAVHRGGTGAWLQILDRHTLEHIGVLIAQRSGEQVEVGVWVTPRRWSCGIAREGLGAILPGLRSRFPDQAVLAEAGVGHGASDRMLRKLGFCDDGLRTGRYGNAVRRYIWRGSPRPPTTDDLPD